VIRTLVVEDDPLIADAHRQFTERVPGFEVAGVAHRGADALRVMSTTAVDLVLLDVQLPDTTGIDLCRALRAQGSQVDVIAITSARDLDTVRAAVSLGIAQYLLKPFTFAAFRDKLLAYAEYRRRTTDPGEALAQEDVDAALSALHDRGRAPLPKGLSGDTLTAVVAVLRRGEALTSADVASAVGASRATARRYLDYLATQRLVRREPRYGRAGRPENVYTWHP
jgi:response regulator of citrate/malate metabolism